MADGGGYGETGDFTVGDYDRILYLVCEFAQAAAQNDSYCGLKPSFCEHALDVVGCSINSFNSWIHIVTNYIFLKCFWRRSVYLFLPGRCGLS